LLGRGRMQFVALVPPSLRRKFSCVCGLYPSGVDSVGGNVGNQNDNRGMRLQNIFCNEPGANW